jgi:hypothetical protein
MVVLSSKQHEENETTNALGEWCSVCKCLKVASIKTFLYKRKCIKKTHRLKLSGAISDSVE